MSRAKSSAPVIAAPSNAAPTETLQQQEVRFKSRFDNVLAEMHLARAETARLRQDSQQHQQDSAQAQRDHAQLTRDFERAKRDYEQLQRDYEVLRTLLRASQQALTGGRPLTPELQRQIDAALCLSGPAPAGDQLAA